MSVKPTFPYSQHKRFVVEIVRGDPKIATFRISDNLKLGITYNAGNLTLSDSPTVFNVKGLPDFDLTVIEEQIPEFPALYVKVVNNGELGMAADGTNLVLPHDDTEIASFIKDYDVTSLELITGKNPAFDFAGHQHHDLQVLIIYGFPVADMLFRKIRADLEVYYRNDKPEASVTERDLPWNSGGTQSHTFCPFINMYCMSRLPDSMVDKARLSDGNSYKTFAYEGWEPYRTPARRQQLEAYFWILDNVVDIYTGLRFRNWVHFILTCPKIADPELRFKPLEFKINGNPVKYNDNNHPPLARRILAYTMALACNTSYNYRDNLTKQITAADFPAEDLVGNYLDTIKVSVGVGAGLSILDFTRARLVDPNYIPFIGANEGNNFLDYSLMNVTDASLFGDQNKIILPHIVGGINEEPEAIARKQLVNPGGLLDLVPNVNTLLTRTNPNGHSVYLTCYSHANPDFNLLISGRRYIDGIGRNLEMGRRADGSSSVDGNKVVHRNHPVTGHLYEDGTTGLKLTCENELKQLFNTINGIWNKTGERVEVSVGIKEDLSRGIKDMGLLSAIDTSGLNWTSNKNTIFQFVMTYLQNTSFVYYEGKLTNFE